MYKRRKAFDLFFSRKSESIFILGYLNERKKSGLLKIFPFFSLQVYANLSFFFFLFG